jgi:hypothetical protein
MRRKVFDVLASSGGLLLVVVLIVAGALSLVGYNYTSSNVHNQLAEQDIYFPSKAAFAAAQPGTEVTPGMRPYLAQYAGQELLDGSQAEAYADHFIAVHLSEMPYHGIYSKISEAALTNPADKALAAEAQTVFQGTALRGLLLEAYAFSVFGQIALLAAIASFALAFAMAILVSLGFWHARKVSADEELLASAITPAAPVAPIGLSPAGG